MSILEICPTKFERPSMMVREGDHHGGIEAVWSAVEFESDLDPFGYSMFDAVRVSTGGEVWLFSNARIAPRSKFGGAFVMIYSSVKLEQQARSKVLPEYPPHSFTKSGPRVF